MRGHRGRARAHTTTPVAAITGLSQKHTTMKALSILPALPAVGRIVHVTLSADLAQSINREPGFRGNAHCEGEVYPMIIARVWPKETYSDGLTVNGQLVLDGVGTFWMTSVHYGDQPGQWRWPHIEHAAELKVCEQSADSSSFDLCDLLNDELMRIKAKLAGNNDPLSKEIVGICERSSLITRQRVPLIEQRDRLEADCAKMQAELREAADQLQRVRAHELHLIQDRDGRISLQVNTEAKLKEVTAERDEILARAKRFQDACTERDQRMAVLSVEVQAEREHLTKRAVEAETLLANVKEVFASWDAMSQMLRATEAVN